MIGVPDGCDRLTRFHAEQALDPLLDQLAGRVVHPERHFAQRRRVAVVRNILGHVDRAGRGRDLGVGGPALDDLAGRGAARARPRHSRLDIGPRDLTLRGTGTGLVVVQARGRVRRQGDEVLYAEVEVDGPTALVLRREAGGIRLRVLGPHRLRETEVQEGLGVGVAGIQASQLNAAGIPAGQVHVGRGVAALREDAPGALDDRTALDRSDRVAGRSPRVVHESRLVDLGKRAPFP